MPEWGGQGVSVKKATTERAVAALAVLFALLLLLAMLLWLDLGTVHSRLEASAELEGHCGSRGMLEPDPETPLAVYVTGAGALVDALLRGTYLALGEDPDLAPRISAVAALPPRLQGDMLTIEVIDRDLLWTPFYASSRLRVRVAYHAGAGRPDKDEGLGTACMRGTMDIRGRGWGLMSRPAYLADLGRRAGLEISRAVQQQAGE